VTTSSVRPVVLRNGVGIEDPLSVVLAFLQAHGRLGISDAAQPTAFGEPDLRLANRGGARISAAEIAAILERRGAIEGALRAIAPDVPLAGAADSVPWLVLRQLFDAFSDIRGVGFAKMTKALHPKRPALIPMLDSIVQKYLQDDDLGAHAPFGERALGLVHGYKRDLDRNWAAVRAVREELAGSGYRLTEVRILDLLILSASAETATGPAGGLLVGAAEGQPEGHLIARGHDVVDVRVQARSVPGGNAFATNRQSGKSSAPARRNAGRPDDDEGVTHPQVRPDPAFGLLKLYDDALPHVYGYLLARCGDTGLAEDLTAESFLAAVHAVRKPGAPDPSIPWLIGVARHKLADHWRRAEREQRGLRLLDGEPARVDDPWETAVDRIRARGVLDRLGAHHRAALTLRYLDGLPVPEVARHLDRTVHATEALLVRARAAFRRIYEGEEGSP
jgi:RNA polymerase sigma-70 factor (ECF subfamily)